MAVGRLRERARVREQSTVDEDDRGPERDVLGQRKSECQPALIHVDALPDCVEHDTEQRPVRSVHEEADRTSSAAEELDV